MQASKLAFFVHRKGSSFMDRKMAAGRYPCHWDVPAAYFGNMPGRQHSDQG